MARFGAIDITRVYSGALNNTFPLTQALCLPYVFDSVPHLRRAIDGHVGDSSCAASSSAIWSVLPSTILARAASTTPSIRCTARKISRA